MMLVLGILLVIFLFGMSIFVHELGHFLAAKYFGFKIEAFSIGFGKSIWSKTVDGVEYKIGFLPFGGYVKLPQLYANLLEGGPSEYKDLPDVSPWAKIVVALAGGFFNILFAFLLGVIIWIVGIALTPMERDATIGWVAKDSAAAAAGIVPGDVITHVQGKGESKPTPVANYYEFFEETALHKEVAITFLPTNGSSRTVTFPTEKQWEYGINGVWDIRGRSIVRVGDRFPPDSKMEAAGIQPEDEIIKVNGQKLMGWSAFTNIVPENEDTEMTLTVLRGYGDETKELEFKVTPERKWVMNNEGKILVDEDTGEAQSRVYAGMMLHTIGKDYRGPRAHPTPWSQVATAGGKVTRVLKALTTPRTAKQAAGAISGPLGIFAVLYEMKEDIMLALALTLLINVNLAIINLLPFPVLDGGHILFAGYRLIVGREMSPKLLMPLLNVFVILLLMLFVFVTFRDYNRWFGGGSESDPKWKTAKELGIDLSQPVPKPPPAKRPTAATSTSDSQAVNPNPAPVPAEPKTPPLTPPVSPAPAPPSPP